MFADVQLPRGLPWYGTHLGLTLLDDGGIAAPEGDVANARSYDFPVQYDLVHGIGGLDLTVEARDDVRDGLVATADRLASRGARAVLAGCGMFGRYQGEVADRARVPVATSSLLQVPLALRLVPTTARVLVVCVDSAWIGDEHLLACGVAEADLGRVVVRGMEDAQHFRANLLGEVDVLDTDVAQAETLAVVRDALDDTIAAVVFECTNLGPYSAAVRAATGLPVWDAVTLARWLHAGVTD